MFSSNRTGSMVQRIGLTGPLSSESTCSGLRRCYNWIHGDVADGSHNSLILAAASALAAFFIIVGVFYLQRTMEETMAK